MADKNPVEKATELREALHKELPDMPVAIDYPDDGEKDFQVKLLDENFDEAKLKKLCKEHSTDGYRFLVGTQDE